MSTDVLRGGDNKRPMKILFPKLIGDVGSDSDAGFPNLLDQKSSGQRHIIFL